MRPDQLRSEVSQFRFFPSFFPRHRNSFGVNAVKVRKHAIRIRAVAVAVTRICASRASTLTGIMAPTLFTEFSNKGHPSLVAEAPSTVICDTPVRSVYAKKATAYATNSWMMIRSQCQKRRGTELSSKRARSRLVN